MTLGSQTYADETYGGGGISISSILPARASREGGIKVVLSGSFPDDRTYLVSVNNVAAYSGIPGQGTSIIAVSDTLTFVMPQLPVGSVGAQTVEVSSVPSGETASTSIDVLERSFGSAAFELRRMFPPWYAAGPRRLELEPQEQ